MSKESNSSSGITLLGLVFIVFLALKLAEVGPVQYWSWWWVTSPIWIPVVLALIGLVLYIISKIGEDKSKAEFYKKKLEEMKANPGTGSKFMQRMNQVMLEKELKKNGGL
jgi:hypothetical protein